MITARRARAWMLAPLLICAAAFSQPVAPDVAPLPGVNATMFASFPVTRTDIESPALDGAWAERFGFTADSRPRGVIFEFTPPHEKPYSIQLSAELPPRGPEGYRGMGELVRLSGETRPVLVLAEGIKACIVPVKPVLEDVKESKPYPTALTFQYVSAKRAGEADGRVLVMAQRTTFSLLDPLGDKPARGVVLFMPGLLGTPPGTVDSLSKVLRQDGWAVLRMWAQPSRFTQTFAVHIDVGGDIGAQAAALGAELGDRLSECAFAVQGAFDHIEDARPALKELPRVAVGFSGGALTMPTVIAREPERYSACVMVGGGADAFLMTLKTSYAMVGGPVYTFANGEPTTEFLTRFDEAYLRATPLDPYHTAGLLKSKRVLMIHGNSDTAVPSPLGELLWERAGRPRRIVREAGHESLFFSLSGDYTTIREFLDESAREAAR